MGFQDLLAKNGGIVGQNGTSSAATRPQRRKILYINLPLQINTWTNGHALHLNEDFADMLAMCHESERVFNVMSIKHGRRQRLHRAIMDTIRHKIMNRLPVGIPRLKQCVEQDAMECYVAKKYSHSYRTMDTLYS